MRVRFITIVVAAALAASVLLGMPGSANAGAATGVGSPNAPTSPASRDGSDTSRKLVDVIFIKGQTKKKRKKHIRRLNKQTNRKKGDLPKCTRAIHVWKKRPSTYSCCAKCRVESPKVMIRPDGRRLPMREVEKRDICIPFTDNCWSPWPYWSAFKIYTGFNNPVARAKCSIAVAAMVIPAGAGWKAIKRVGSAKDYAKRLMNSHSWEQWRDRTASIAGEVFGWNMVKKYCKPSFDPGRTGREQPSIRVR